MNHLHVFSSTLAHQVLINGRQAGIHVFKQHVGFVPQEDVMHRELTVREILMFNAQVSS